MSKNSNNISGQALVSDYLNAFLSIIAVESAKNEASRSEDYALNSLGSISGGNYLNPGNIPEYSQEEIVRSSLDAHVKKVQAGQMESMNNSQLTQLMEDDQKLYKNKKVRIRATTKTSPFEVIQLDSQYQTVRKAISNRTIVGKIEEVLLDQNVLILKPTFVRGFIKSKIQYYIVYVVNPDTLIPDVQIDILK